MRWLACAFVAAMAGCASRRPPPELLDARAAYAHAEVGPAVQANMAGLHDARRALDDAERKFADDPSSPEARDLAYIAQRKAMLANANARAAIAGAQRVQAERAIVEMRSPKERVERSERKARSE